MKQRTITAIFFAAIMIGGIYWSRLSFQLLFTLIAGVMLWEFFGLVFSKDEPYHLFRRIFGCGIGLFPVLWIGATFIIPNFFGNESEGNADWSLQLGWGLAFMVFTSFLTLLALLLELFWPGKMHVSAIGYFLLSLFYIGLPIVFLFFLTTRNGAYLPNRVFGLLWLIWTNDTIAYLVGSRFGKNKLYERISPKKTWEGTIGGAIGTVLMALLFTGWFPDYNPDQWLALGIIVAILATPGDLIESMLKRSAGVKDSGSIMPGHGGLLDRFDSFIFVLPFAWLAVELLGG